MKKQDQPADTGNKFRRRRLKPVIIVLDVLIVALALSGLYFLLRPVVIHYLQDRLTDELSEQYDNGGGTIEIDPDALPLEGEDVDYFRDVEETTAPSSATTTLSEPSGATSGSTSGTSAGTASETSQATTAPAPTPVPKKVTVRAIGRIIIPSIDVNMPLAEGIEKYTLRLAPGRYTGRAGIGEPGLCVIFGHRMYAYGRHFNRLGEVKIGQEIILQDKTNRYVYEVDRIDTVTPEEVPAEIYKEVEGSRIMLVTCTPIRVASHRLLVKGKLVRTEPLG